MQVSSSGMSLTSPARRRILFVDDEASVLTALEDLLRRERRRWDMEFALGSEAALDALAVRSFDVVVSDLRMPGIDGEELLRRVQALHPRTARVVLSGHAEPDMVSRVQPLAHALLSKPCPADVLRATIETSLSALDAEDGGPRHGR